MKKIKPLLFFSILLLTISCKNETKINPQNNNKEKTEVLIDREEFIHKSVEELYTKKSVIEEIKFENKISIKWLEKGNGEKINDEDVIRINYEVSLEDGKVIDGNQIKDRDWFPFLVGYNMQTKGWDFAFKHLKVGDLVEIFIPSELARGEKGIKDKKSGDYIIPPNANNILRVKILGKLPTYKNIDGVKVWKLEANSEFENSNKINENNIVDIHYIVGTKSNPNYDMSYRRNMPYTLKFSDYGVVSGLKMALLGLKKHDKVWITIPAKYAYKSEGYLDIVKPNESLFYNLIVYDIR